MPILTAIVNIDTGLLRQQRDWLLGASLCADVSVDVTPDGEITDGLVNLLDALLDDAEGFSQPTPAPTRPEPRRSLSEPQTASEAPLDEQRRSFEEALPALAGQHEALPGLTALAEREDVTIQPQPDPLDRGLYGSDGLSADAFTCIDSQGRGVGMAALRTEIGVLRHSLRRLASSVAVHDAKTADEVAAAWNALADSVERVA